MSKSKALQRASDEARAAAEEKLSLYMANIEVLQDKLRAGGTEVARGNEIISRFQGESRQLREKLKLKVRT
jgi:hypothetical protein